MHRHPDFISSKSELDLPKLSLDQSEERWPDQEGKKGRPRVILRGYIRQALMRSIYYRVIRREIAGYGGPWTCIYFHYTYQSTYNQRKVFLDQLLHRLPHPLDWEEKIERHDGNYYLLIRFVRKDIFTGVQQYDGWLDWEWFNSMFQEHKRREEEETLNPQPKLSEAFMIGDITNMTEEERKLYFSLDDEED